MISESAVLVVIDAQVGFASEHSQHAIHVMADLLKQWQGAGRPSILTQFVNRPDSPYVRLIGWSELMPGDPEGDFCPEIAPYAATATAVIRKSGYTALTREVVEMIEANGWTDVVIAGLDTDSCVLATALGAFETGNLVPWVLTDAVAAHAGPQVHEAALVVLGRFLGRRQLITTGDIPPALLTPVESAQERHIA